jgi:hypothetical protein
MLVLAGGLRRLPVERHTVLVVHIRHHQHKCYRWWVAYVARQHYAFFKGAFARVAQLGLALVFAALARIGPRLAAAKNDAAARL